MTPSPKDSRTRSGRVAVARRITRSKAVNADPIGEATRITRDRADTMIAVIAMTGAIADAGATDTTAETTATTAATGVAATTMKFRSRAEAAVLRITQFKAECADRIAGVIR